MLKNKFKFDFVCVPHSVSLDDNEVPNSIIMNGHQKLQDYITYRESRLDQLISCCLSGKKTREQIYDFLYGERNLQGHLRNMAYQNLDQQIEYLQNCGKLEV